MMKILLVIALVVCKLLQFFVCFFLLLLLFYMLDVVSITVYDRHMLLNIGSSFAQRKPDFEFLNAGALFTDTVSEPFVRPRWKKQSRRKGNRAGVLLRLRRRAFQPPLPTILLANVQSLDNKLCELRARISYQWETRDCYVICLTETWMSAMVPDSAIELTGFPFELSRDITENSPLWELLPFNLSWSPIGSRQSRWLANCRKACKYDELETV